MGEKSSVLKPIYFNKKKDQTRLEFINSLDNFSEWVKGMVDKAIEEKYRGKQPQELDPNLAKLIERMIDIRLSNKVVVTQNVNPYESESVVPDQEVLESELDQFL